MNEGTFVIRGNNYESCLDHVFIRSTDNAGIKIALHCDLLDINFSHHYGILTTIKQQQSLYNNGYYFDDKMFQELFY